MGTTCLIAATGATPAMLAQAEAMVEDLEAKWSRFRPGSELRRLGHSNGEALAVSPETFRLVALACAAWEGTGGAFDPTVGAAMVANGYAVSFDDIDASATPTAAQPTPGCGAIELDAHGHTITVPPGVALDAGGIGKGLAADLVSAFLVDLGATGVLVDLGGDIRCRGIGPADGQWVVEVTHPFTTAPLARLALCDGAVVTSSTQRRRWGNQREMHHIVDPRTGLPSTSPVVAATVVAGDAWWAEPLATAIVVTGSLAVLTNAEALAVYADGTVAGSPSLMALCA